MFDYILTPVCLCICVVHCKSLELHPNLSIFPQCAGIDEHGERQRFSVPSVFRPNVQLKWYVDGLLQNIHA